MAERSLKALEGYFPANHVIFLRVLRILAVSQLQQGKTSGARKTFQRMTLIEARQPEDSAIVAGMSAALFHKEGRWKEAATAYGNALAGLNKAGLDHSTDAASIWIDLGSSYLEQGRLDEASRAAERSLAIFTTAKDAVPLDFIGLLNLKATVYTRKGRWREAEAAMRDAVDLAERQPLDPGLAATVLNNYAYILGKNHKPKDARAVKVRATALRGMNMSSALVDVTELPATSSGKEK